MCPPLRVEQKSEFKNCLFLNSTLKKEDIYFIFFSNHHIKVNIDLDTPARIHESEKMTFSETSEVLECPNKKKRAFPLSEQLCTFTLRIYILFCYNISIIFFQSVSFFFSFLLLLDLASYVDMVAMEWTILYLKKTPSDCFIFKVKFIQCWQLFKWNGQFIYFQIIYLNWNDWTF